MAYRIASVLMTLSAFQGHAPEMEPGHGSPGHWVTGSAILTGPGRVTGQCVGSVFYQVLSFNMRIYRGVVSTE